MPWAVLFVDDSPWTYSSSVWFVGHPDIENWFIVTRVAVRSSTGIAMKGRKWKKKIIIVNLQTTLLIILLINQWIQCQGIQMIVFFDCWFCESIDRTLLSLDLNIKHNTSLHYVADTLLSVARTNLYSHFVLRHEPPVQYCISIVSRFPLFVYVSMYLLR